MPSLLLFAGFHCKNLLALALALAKMLVFCLFSMASRAAEGGLGRPIDSLNFGRKHVDTCRAADEISPAKDVRSENEKPLYF